MGNVDIKRLSALIGGLSALIFVGYYLFSAGPESPGELPGTKTLSPAGISGPASRQPPTPTREPGIGPAARTGTQTTSYTPPQASPTPRALPQSGPTAAPALKNLSGAKETEPVDLPDPFSGVTAELVRLKREAALLEGKIKILDLKGKQAKAELEEKQTRTLAGLIEKNPDLLLRLSLSDKTKGEGGLLPSLNAPLPSSSLGPPGAEPLKPSPETSFRRAISPTPVVRMVMLGKEKSVTIEIDNNTYTLSVGDKVQDIEVLNVTPRGALLKVAGKREFAPVNETQPRSEKKEGEQKSEVKQRSKGPY